MPIFDVVCIDCKIIKEDVMLKAEAGAETPIDCPECGLKMRKKPGFGSFELKYNNKTDSCDWNGETSQYYRAYNEAKARGENVRPGDEE